MKLGRDKTASGSNRTVPLTPRAAEALAFWAQRFPDRAPTHHVFAHERYGASGSDETFGFTAPAVYDLDPTRPTGAVKVAWEGARKRASLPTLRLHDLRHSAASRMIAGRIPLPMVARILGWSGSTLAKMALRYGHFSLAEMGEAMDSIARPEPASAEVSQGSPKKSPKSGVPKGVRVQ